jgi:hypothetical protein
VTPDEIVPEHRRNRMRRAESGRSYTTIEDDALLDDFIDLDQPS